MTASLIDSAQDSELNSGIQSKKKIETGAQSPTKGLGQNSPLKKLKSLTKRDKVSPTKI